MKFLILSDLHSMITHYFIEEIIEKENIDLVILLGDLTNFGPAEFVLDIFTDKKPILAIPGNCDPPDVLNYIDKSGMINMHKNKYKFKDLEIIGLGGSDFNFINMGIGYSDEEAYNFLVDKIDENSILMLHQPPYGILDSVKNMHAGNKGIRKAVDEKKPKIVMSGHIHEERGSLIYNGTLFFNPGPAKEGYYAILDYDEFKVHLMKK